jgi:hypothetical protein
MSTTDTGTAGADPASPPRYRRKLRNYLIDVGLQIRYTAFIILIAAVLTALLGYKIYEAVKETSEVILVTGYYDPSTTAELKEMFRSNDRTVLFGVASFGLLLVLSVAAAGIWITHKVAGPLFSIEGICARVRDNKLAPSLRQQLRKGDELQEFYSTFRDMYESLRTRADRDVQVLRTAIAQLEQAGAGSASMREPIDDLRRLQAEKEASLEP